MKQAVEQFTPVSAETFPPSPEILCLDAQFISV